MPLLLLHESSTGYALFEKNEVEEILDQSEQIQKNISDFSTFQQMVTFKGFLPFQSAESALDNCTDVSEGQLNATLKNFLQASFPKKLSKVTLGVLEDKLGTAIQDNLGVSCVRSTLVQELLRGIRFHFDKFIPELSDEDVRKAQLGLAHSYSRAKVKFNVNRVDNMIIQSICLLDQLDKDLNTFSMRCREWYSWHFPELSRIVPDQKQYAKLAKYIREKANLSDESLAELTEITENEDKSTEILEAARASMGQDISEIDMINIENFADRVIHLANYRTHLYEYLVNKMHVVAPNLTALIGELVGARLISHAGSLTNLSKLPASTVQILGAEKALFRALKTKGNTPKYGLIYHSSFIGRAGTKNKGRVSRYLANKCTIASRLDNFSDNLTDKFGLKMKDQVEERLRFYENGAIPRKNADVMQEVMDEIKADGLYHQLQEEESTPKSKKDKKKKKKSQEMEVEVEPEAPSSEKKKKKRKSLTVEEPVETAEPMEEEPPKKREHKKKKKSL